MHSRIRRRAKAGGAAGERAPDLRACAAAGGLGLSAFWLGPGLAAHWPPLARALGIPLRCANHTTVALTFDDGPHPKGTADMIEILRDSGATAIFFLVAEQVARFPSLAAEIVAAGHELGVHGFQHRNQMRLGPRALADDTRRAIDVIGELAGRRPRLYRPPYGAFTPAGLSIVRRLGLQPLLWSRWGRDWQPAATPASIASLVSAELTCGDVVLLHDADWYSSPGAWRATVEALPLILAAIEARGLLADGAGADLASP